MPCLVILYMSCRNSSTDWRAKVKDSRITRQLKAANYVPHGRAASKGIIELCPVLRPRKRLHPQGLAGTGKGSLGATQYVARSRFCHVKPHL